MIGFVSFGGAASTAAAESHARTVTGYYSLAASPLTPDGLGMTNEDYFDQWDPSTLSNQDNGRCFNAGLSVPAGATMKSVSYTHLDVYKRQMRLGLDHLAFGCQTREESWSTRLDDLGISRGEIVDAWYGSGLAFRDPDNIQLEFFVLASS